MIHLKSVERLSTIILFTLPLSTDDLLLHRLKLLHNTLINLQRTRHNIRRGQRKPLRQTDINNPIALVQLDPYQSLILRRILDIMTRVVGENGSVTSTEVKGSSIGTTKEHGGLSMPLSEIKPFFRLFRGQKKFKLARERNPYIWMPM